MGLYVNPNEALLKKAMNSKIYVDKSMMIHELNQLINTEQNYVCVSRARRFGKSMMSGMLVAYYSKKANSRSLPITARKPIHARCLKSSKLLKVPILKRISINTT